MHDPNARPQTQHPPSHKKGGSRGSRDKGLIGFWGRKLYRQPTRAAVGTIVTIHRGGVQDRSSWTARTVPKNLEPFKLSSAGRPRYWALRQRRASTGVVISTVCTMTSSGQTAHAISQILTYPSKWPRSGRIGPSHARPTPGAHDSVADEPADAALHPRRQLAVWAERPAAGPQHRPHPKARRCRSPIMLMMRSGM